MSDAEIGYADAMAELESILDDLEDDDLDVDVLASRVERASTLITLCRDRIGAARVQVERVVASLDDAAPTPDAGDDDITLDLDGE
jgi:exodeoxyribonuclease VII small subunit